MAGYCTHGQYFHSPLAGENTLPTRAISCHITLSHGIILYVFIESKEIREERY